jgi:site-specific DNA recombinase
LKSSGEADNIDKLNNIDIQRQLEHGTFVDPFRGYPSLDIADKKHLVKLFPPNEVNFQTGEISLELIDALSKILVLNIKSHSKK